MEPVDIHPAAVILLDFGRCEVADLGTDPLPLRPTNGRPMSVNFLPFRLYENCPCICGTFLSSIFQAMRQRNQTGPPVNGTVALTCSGFPLSA